jgi:hypothetical protein
VPMGNSNQNWSGRSEVKSAENSESDASILCCFVSSFQFKKVSMKSLIQRDFHSISSRAILTEVTEYWDPLYIYSLLFLEIWITFVHDIREKK